MLWVTQPESGIICTCHIQGLWLLKQQVVRDGGWFDGDLSPIVCLFVSRCAFSTWLFLTRPCSYRLCGLLHHINSEKGYTSPTIFLTNSGMRVPWGMPTDLPASPQFEV